MFGRCHSELANMQQLLILKAREKALRSTNNHPKCVALATDIPQGLQNCYSFRRKANNFSTLLSIELQHQRNINHFPSTTWQLTTPYEKPIATNVLGITGWANDVDLKCSLNIIASYQADCTI